MPPALPLHAWAVDDWEISGAESVEEVLTWVLAHAEQGATVELFVRSDAEEAWTRILGDPPEGSAHQVKVPLEY
jgi:hypothetical protein